MADVSVRPARLGDVPRMTAVQLSSWQSIAGLPGGGDAMPDATDCRPRVGASRHRAPHRATYVWVATAGEALVGLAALAPASDPIFTLESVTELLLLAVAPEHRKQGHGSRLLAATMDRLICDQQDAAVTWVTAQDDRKPAVPGKRWVGHRRRAPHTRAA